MLWSSNLYEGRSWIRLTLLKNNRVVYTLLFFKDYFVEKNLTKANGFDAL